MYTEERKAVCDLIRKFGVTSKYKGYLITVEAILMYIQKQDECLMNTKDVYPDLAKKFRVSTKIIERNIRSVIGVCWKNNKELLLTIANYILPKAPSNSEFLDVVAYYISTSRNH